MKYKFIFTLFLILILSSSYNTFEAKSKGAKLQFEPLSQVQDNRLEIIIYLEGHEKDGNVRLGYSVAGIGDVNLDGYDDVLIGNPLKGPGEAWLLFGGAKMDSLPDLILHGEEGHDGFGVKVAAGGDINGDGDPDFLISERSRSDVYTGSVYLYFGGSLLDTIPDLILKGERLSHNFGEKVVAGDVNGDHCSDILISTITYGHNTAFGKVYLYYGGSLLDTIPDWTNQGDSFLNYFGHSLAIGDVNGDQKKDILILSLPTIRSPEGHDSTMTNTEIFLNKCGFDTTADFTIFYSLWGNHSYDLLFCSDLNQDGIDDFHTNFYGYKIYYGSPQLDLDPDAYLEPWPLTAITQMKVAGDVNGDGYPDILGGAPHPVFERGSIQLFLGSKNINSTVDWVVGGTGYLGLSIDRAGDVNGDGYDDIIFSNSILPFTGIGEGQVYIMAGNPNLEDLGVAYAKDQLIDNKPAEFQLYQNYPNPFNQQTTIAYKLNTLKKQPVKLIIYNIQGEEVITLIYQFQSAGEYQYIWDGKDRTEKEVNSGVYLAVLRINEFHQVIKLLLVK